MKAMGSSLWDASRFWVAGLVDSVAASWNSPHGPNYKRVHAADLLLVVNAVRRVLRRKGLSSVTAALAALTLGCVDITCDVTLRSNGSGAIAYELYSPLLAYDPDGFPEWFFKDSRGTPGVEIALEKLPARKGWGGFRQAIAFDTIEHLTQLYRRHGRSLPVVIRQKEPGIFSVQTCSLEASSQGRPRFKEQNVASPQEDLQSIALAKAMYRDARVAIHLRLPGQIVEAPGEKLSDRELRWVAEVNRMSVEEFASWFRGDWGVRFRWPEGTKYVSTSSEEIRGPVVLTPPPETLIAESRLTLQPRLESVTSMTTLPAGEGVRTLTWSLRVDPRLKGMRFLEKEGGEHRLVLRDGRSMDARNAGTSWGGGDSFPVTASIQMDVSNRDIGSMIELSGTVTFLVAGPGTKVIAARLPKPGAYALQWNAAGQPEVEWLGPSKNNGYEVYGHRKARPFLYGGDISAFSPEFFGPQAEAWSIDENVDGAGFELKWNRPRSKPNAPATLKLYTAIHRERMDYRFANPPLP
jgi:hypothetical protein